LFYQSSFHHYIHLSTIDLNLSSPLSVADPSCCEDICFLYYRNMWALRFLFPFFCLVVAWFMSAAATGIDAVANIDAAATGIDAVANIATNVDVDIDSQLAEVIADSFHAFHGFLPKPWQVQTCQHLLRSIIDDPPGAVPILLCRPTGGGKSAVRDCASFAMGGGVCLTIVPLLALAGDQTTKIRKAAERQEAIRVYNLDEIKTVVKKSSSGRHSLMISILTM
jgi:hypothetical protein